METSAPRDPPRTLGAILRSIGPGLIITANIVGTGELIMTTRLGAQAGFTLLWFILLGCFIKVFVQIEWGRTTILTGRSSLQALNDLPGPRLRVSWAVWLWFGMYLGTFFQLSGMLTALGSLMAPDGRPWAHRACAFLVAASVAGLLLLGRYRLVERASTLMVAGFTLSTVLALALIQGTRWAVRPGELASGFAFRFGDDFLTAFGAFAITGVGAAELVFYPIWLLEKGYARAAGPPDGTPAWEARARGWIRVMTVDAWASMAIYTVATAAFYLLGAAVLHRDGLRVSDEQMIPTLSRLYESAFGGAGPWIFLAGAFMVLYSTLFVSTASDGRLFADLLAILGLLAPDAERGRRRAIRGAIVAVLLIALGLYLYGQARGGLPVSLVTVGAVAQGIMLPFLGLAAVYFRHRFIPAALRPGRTWTLFLWISFLAMTAVGVYQAGKTLSFWR
ncbi:MAG TPA: Nramp family divalent metal transporter [Planctomycetota bacterium]|nr:Nramp family divalent metal transporter [Planctomycetota bacterium]